MIFRQIRIFGFTVAICNTERQAIPSSNEEVIDGVNILPSLTKKIFSADLIPSLLVFHDSEWMQKNPRLKDSFRHRISL
ncbi:hypothetical protein LEP1GSC047_1254 [Leptospira inadai serovar Lyme str. 10]|uniref:Uncharacterized protein n=1 Tax=Leptospira inadai serovar Lyme str. 10 TaxID=1049790 RepID=V6H8P3_9LEPT|nr:hypothetical protein LEP1GSC047_1254 [Leptospira inadai serovar Lyme str. 10]